MLTKFGKSFLLFTLLSLFAISNTFADNFYWVGNSGNWNDAAHWSNTSGGNGGFGVPTMNDDVYFDFNSFTQANQIVTINNNVSFNNIKIPSRVLKFELKSSQPITIDVYGTIDVSAIFNNELKGIINLKSNNSNTKHMNFGNWNWKTDFNFNGKGSYVFNSPLLTPENTVTLSKGEINMNTNDIVCSAFISNSGLKRKLLSNGADILAHNLWSTNSTKFVYDFNQTNIYVLNQSLNAVNKGGDSYNIIQSQPNNSATNKTITSITIFDDTVSCGNVCDGMLYIDNVVTDCPPATVINWVGAPPQPIGDTTFNLCPGSYTAVMEDACGFVFGQAANVLGHPPILPILEITNTTSCKSLCDGSVSVTVIGASYANMTFTWNPIGFVTTIGTTTSNTTLCAGPVSLNVTDGFGCDTTFFYNVPEPDSLFVNVSVTDPLCFGECTGSAVSTPNGGTPPYDYVWTTPPATPADTFATINNLCAGTAYSVTVTDVSGCSNDTTVTPSSPPQIILDSSSLAVTCGGACDGEATVTVLGGGTGPFTHNWSNGTVFVGNSSTINALCPNTYCDTVVDANGCDTVYCFVITEPLVLTTSTTPTDLTCNGICNGTAVTTPNGGAGGYNYVWTAIPAQPFGGQGTDSIFNLCPGQYIVDVTDGNGCMTSDTITINEPPPIVVNPTGTNITCPGFNDGTATTNPTGGTGSPATFTYQWTGPACSAAPYFTQSIASLCPGTYIVTVTDSVGCTAVDSVVISEPPPLNLVMSSTDETCAGACDGTAAVNATGGYAPLSYTWVPDPGVPNGQGTDSIFNLCAANYVVTVTDSAGCSANNNITVNPAQPIVDNLVTSDLSCNGVCNGTATVSPTGGTAPYTANWNGAGPGANIPAGGSETILNLCAGPHNVIITDALGCSITVNFNISEPPALTVNTNTVDVSCFGMCDGTASTNAGGGSGSLTYFWDQIPSNLPISGQGTDSIFNLCQGTYYVTITDDSACTINDTIVIFEPTEILPNATFTDITCNGMNDGTATATPTGGAPPYVSIVWNTLPGGPIIPGNPINSLGPGQYEVTVTDANGCTGKDTVTITDPQPLTLSADATAASCGTICDGSALATPTGGTPGYTYDIGNGPQTSPVFPNLCQGTYTITVTDTNGCTAQDTTVINPLITITINPTIVGISCNGVCDGSATVFPVGGTTPYTYLWNAPPPNTDSIINGLCPGYAVVTVTDANGCATTDSVQMPVDPSVLQTNDTLLQPISCAGACDGIVSHSPTGGTPPYVSVWTPLGIDTNNVCSPFAIITVTDANNCVQSDTIIVSDPLPITPNDVVVDVLCNGDSTGSITLNPTGGTGGQYTFTWTSGPVIGSGSSTNNLPAGIYTIEISDSNGCTIIVTDTINEPPVLSSIPIGIDISCNGLCDGIMAVTVNGGVQPYSYVWGNSSPPTLNATGDTLFNVCAPFLSNTVTVTDSNGCQTSQNITIIEPNALNANVTGTPIGCSSNCDGTALSSPTGGVAPYQYSWAPNLEDSAGITGLCIGNYTVTVTDTNGCIDTASYTVTSPSAIAVTLDSTNITCTGANDGTATATPTGGTLPYTYSWVGPACNPNPGNTASISGLCPGVYTVAVTDSNNCIFIGSINIVEPQPIDDNEVITGANCGVCDGSIVMFPSGGTPPYSHSWDTGNPADTTASLTGLCAGFYTDTITDANGCTAIFTLGVTNPTGPSGITATVNDATCSGACDGSLNAIPIGGVAPFTWAWTGPSCPASCPSDSTITGLCAGTYNLTLTENSTGCILATSLVVGEADSITANSTFTDATCNSICDGTASVTPTGGTPPYSFVWSNNGSTASSISGLCAGPVSVTITDFNGCTNVVNFNISSPNALTISSTTTDPLCNVSCDGSATANPVGGTGPFTYQWDDPSAQTTQTAAGLCAGTYIVTVTDFNGCSGNDTVILTDPTIILANAVTTNSTCGNSDGTANVCASSGGTGVHTYNWPSLGSNSCNVSGLAAGTYVVEITDANGCMQPFLVTISDANGPTVSVNSTNASCNGVCDGQATATVTSGTPNYTYLWQTGGQTTQSVTGLCAGSYSVQVTDGNGCITTMPVNITDNTSITASVSTIDATCNGMCDGSALVMPSGGVPPYSYSWTGGNAAGQTINAVGGLCAGNYTVTITDALGCSFIQNVTINEPNVLTVSVAGVAANCNGACDGSATATPTGGTGPFTYLWSTGATTPTITALCSGNYTVTVTDANGCSGNGNVVISDGNSITATINTVDATCGQCDGSISVTGSGGSGAPFTYLWSPGGQTTSSISNLCPGAYQVDITDNLGCSQQFNILINNANGPSLTTLADSVTCFGSCDGLAYTTVTAGNPTYIYQWDDPILQTNDSATALCAGLYNVVVQDGLGCVTVDSITVPEPQEILANATLTDPSCNGVCDGTATVAPTGGVGTLTIQWGASAGNQTTATASGLCAGTHLVTITDDNGCSIIDSVTLTDPTNISITISATLPTCSGDCDGTAVANASGGTAPYTYSWNTVPVSNSSLVGGLCAGTYIVTVTDNNGCTDTASVQVINPPVLTTVSTPNPLTCNGACDGSITTAPAGGVPPYTYIWSNGDTTQTTTSTLCAGTYYVTVVDANNCAINDTTTLNAAPMLNDSTVIIDPTCNLCDGSATSTPVGGVGPFDFVWTNLTAPPFTQTDLNVASSTAAGLCAGTYDLQITDLGTGCVYNYTIIVNNSNGPTLAMGATDETCANACDGTATVNPSGGTAPYSFSWSPTGPPVDTNQTATGLCVVQYTVTVTDSNNCISSDTISVNTNGLNLTISSIVPETCFGDCDGSATVSVTGGIPTYTYLWNPTSQTTPQASNLCVGNYVVTVTDSALCSDSISANITGPQMLTVTANLNTPVSCFGMCDGAAIANVLGGTTNYTYAWNDPANQTTQIATGLCAGTYIVTITDNNGCTAMDTITITEPTEILANEIIVAPACGVCDGSIAVSPTGGTGPYTFLWTTPSAPPSPQPITSTINNLCAGPYTLAITDSTGCVANFNYPLSNINAPVPNTTVTNVTCNGLCDGQITSAPTGGVLPYTYLWSSGIPNNTSTITGLCVGQYSLSVTDSVGCVGVAIDSVTQPAVLLANLNASNINCSGVCDGWAVSNTLGGTTPYAYNWTSSPAGQVGPGQGTDSITSLCAGTYFVTVTDSNSCNVTDSVTIIEPTIITATSTQVDATCTANCDGSATITPVGGIGPYTYEWNGNTTPGQGATQTGLCFGLNTVVITDQNGCSITDSVNIGATDTVLANAGPDTTICFGATANLNGIPGGTFTNVEWFELPSMVSLGTTNSVSVTPSATGVFCYAYQVTGACIYTDTVCVTVDPLPTANAGPDVTIFENTSTNLGATGGTTYTWTPSSGLSDTTISNPVASPLVTTTYYVTVTSANGCTATDSVIVTVLPNIKFPDGISPNGDGANDVWIIDFIEQFPNNVVEIYNRWGELLFHADGYLQNWDGTYNGEELPIGTYYYIIDLHEEGIKPFTGPITILR